MSNSAIARLKKDYFNLKREPMPYVTAEPLPYNMLEWHYVIRGPENSPYEGGYYHGKLVFPIGFPFKAPSIYMITPNGRFETNMRLCLSMSDYHPEEWDPTWTVSTILNGLLSFMLEETGTSGSIVSPVESKRKFAFDSLEFNLNNKNFRELFPDTVATIQETLRQRHQKTLGQSNQDTLSQRIQKALEQRSQETFGQRSTAKADVADNQTSNQPAYSHPTNSVTYVEFLMTHLILIVCIVMYYYRYIIQ